MSSVISHIPAKAGISGFVIKIKKTDVISDIPYSREGGNLRICYKNKKPDVISDIPYSSECENLRICYKNKKPDVISDIRFLINLSYQYRLASI